MVAFVLGAEDIVHLWFALNALAAGGGDFVIEEGRIPRRWAPAADGVSPYPFRLTSLAHLTKNGYFTVRREGSIRRYRHLERMRPRVPPPLGRARGARLI